MRAWTRGQCQVCLPHQFRTGRLHAVTRCKRPITPSSCAHFSIRYVAQEDAKRAQAKPQNLDDSSSNFRGGFFQTSEPVQKQQEARSDRTGKLRSNNRVQWRQETAGRDGNNVRGGPFDTSLWHPTDADSTGLELSEIQQKELNDVHDLRQRLSRGLQSISEIRKDPSIADGIIIDEIVKALPHNEFSQEQRKVITRLETSFSGQTFGVVRDDLDLATTYRDPNRRTVTDPKAKSVLARLGVVENHSEQSANDTPSLRENQTVAGQDNDGALLGKTQRRQSLAAMVAAHQPTSKKAPPKATKPELKPPPFPSKTIGASSLETVAARELVLSSVDIGSKAVLPRLSFDLSRVLFNPGVYQLQDPRSRVYNFDPYLEEPMPLSEFNFEALNPYMTSSEDQLLIKLAKERQKRYIGSSSSTTAILSHFHFLISQWRDLNIENISRGFSQPSQTFTVISRSPAAIFLRWRDGVYAVDADKEYDEPNVLMSLGQAMEKLLTLEKDEFEKWRRSNSAADDQPLQQSPEAFHYSEQGRVLLRSQLDVHDPRLPGTGYFDLKTRAVAGVRMNIQEHEAGMGYQIKERFGTWESYEREYYDMMRSTFLKYSLQARMGNMDGIFVAYHNITRVFGFQYIPMSEMDLALHGQNDPCLGDQEFRFSINFLEEIFNMGTQAFPKRSLRIHFETREATVTEPKPYMNIFIEPMAEEDIITIQNSQKAQFDSFERKLLRGEDPGPLIDIEGELKDDGAEDDPVENDQMTEMEGEPGSEKPALPVNTMIARPTGPASSAANTAFLDSILNTRAARMKPKPEHREILGLKLTVQNKINGRPVARVDGIAPAARWEIDYSLETRSEDAALKLYRQCRNRRMAALKTAMNRGSDDYFIRSIRQMSEKGAEWRRQQDELDAQRERIVLYERRS